MSSQTAIRQETIETIALAASVGLSNLQNEPARLTAEAENINQELELLVLQNYNLFVENLSCSTRLREEDTKIDLAAKELSQKLTILSEKCKGFKDQVSQVVETHKRNRKTLSQHMQLVELLEIPQLVDACARNDYHDEAIELANFVNNLERRYLLVYEDNLSQSKYDSTNTSKSPRLTSATPNSARNYTNTPRKDEDDRNQRKGHHVIQIIVDEVLRTMITLRHQLLKELTENVTLSRELHILTILRKLDNLFIDRKLSFLKLEQKDINNSLYSISSSEIAMKEIRIQLIRTCETKLQMDFLDARSIWLYKRYENMKYQEIIPSSSSSSLPSNNLNSSPNSLTDPPSSGISLGGSTSTTTTTNKPIGVYGKIIEVLELYRTSWFSVITQFTTLFQDRESLIGSHTTTAVIGTGTTMTAAGSATSSSSFMSQLYDTMVGTNNTATNTGSVNTSQTSNSNVVIPSNLLLSSWLNQQIHELITKLKYLLPQLEDGVSYRAIMEHCILFATRLNDISGNFTTLIIPVFEEIQYEYIQVNLQLIFSHFKNMVSTERYTMDVSDPEDSILNEQIVPLFTVYHLENTYDDVSPISLTSSTTTTTTLNDSSSDLHYIHELMIYVPLAYLYNDFIEIFNYIRECPILNLKYKLLEQIKINLENICKFILYESKYIQSRGMKYLYEDDTIMNNNNSRNTSNPSKNNTMTTQLKSNTSMSSFSNSKWIKCCQGKDYITIPKIPITPTTTTTTTTPITSEDLSPSSSSSCTLDKMYIQALCKILIPHILYTFDSIYDSASITTTTTTLNMNITTDMKKKQMIIPIRIHTYYEELEHKLSKESYSILKSCWKIFENTNVLPMKKAINTNIPTLITPSVSLSNTNIPENIPINITQEITATTTTSINISSSSSSERNEGQNQEVIEQNQSTSSTLIHEVNSNSTESISNIIQPTVSMTTSDIDIPIISSARM